MSAPMISVRAVSKSYRVGGPERPPDSIREAIGSVVRAPLSRLRSRRSRADDTFWALDNVSFDVQQGDVVGLLGRNGAGKSTILKVISRITEPTRGRIELRGRVASLLEVGTGFHPELTGRENIYMNGTILGMRRREIDRKFDQIVAFSEIERFIDTPVKRYSSGMYVRLAFAVAAHLDPEILVVDEVLAVGDAEFQKKCLGTMSDAAQSGRTVLFVSHNMAAMRALCSRAILLDRGRVALDGGVEEGIKGYLEQTHSDAPQTEWKYLWKNPRARVVADDIEMIVNGEVMRTVQSGDRCTFRIHYHATSPEFVGTRYSPEIRLYADGQKVLSMAPHIHDGMGIAAEERGAVDCTIERWPFRTRNMRLELVPWAGPEAQEHVLECMTFSSYDGDYYASGVVPGQDDGFVFVDHRWSPIRDAAQGSQDAPSAVRSPAAGARAR